MLEFAGFVFAGLVLVVVVTVGLGCYLRAPYPFPAMLVGFL